MIESFFSGIVRLLAWLWTSAMTLYYLAGFFIVLGGFIIFAASVIHHFWSRSAEERRTSDSDPRVTVHVENLNLRLEVTEPQMRRLLTEDTLPALEPGPSKAEENGPTT